jgi:ABC-type transport system involved in multi-copper enzyme maturation permease subunit
MTAVVPPSNSAQQDVTDDAVSGAELRLERLDAWCEKWGDWCNPILVKETRQALKSRQFVITFSLLLFAALSWTIIGTFSLMPAIYETPSAPRMMLGYYFVLALPMLLVVPLAAYRSLEGEIDDGTLELLSITTLSPKQVVWGKLASAMLQMLLYFVVLFPCVSYAYTLRGVDFPTTVVLLGMLILAGIMMTIVALFFAPLSRSRTGRVTMLLVVIMLLAVAEWLLGLAAVEMITSDASWWSWEDSVLYENSVLYLGGLVLLVAPAVGYLLLTVTAAQLTPVIDNRSTKIRFAMLLVNAAVVAWVTLASTERQTYTALGLMWCAGMGLILLWGLASSMLVSESAVLTPRVQRGLPQSFLARATLTWLAPGPATGLVFATLNVWLLVGLMHAGVSYFFGDGNTFNVREEQILLQFGFAVASYLTFFLVLVYGLMRLLRRKNNPRVEVGLAGFVVVAVFASLGPYGIQLYLNDFLDFPYSYWQATNWVWTLYSVADGVDCYPVIKGIGVIGALGVLGIMWLNPAIVRPRRIATPKRVLEERAMKALDQD